MTRLRYSSRSGRGNLAGEVAANGDVYAQNDLGRRFVGRIDAEGRVWDATENNVGSVASDNQIYDINGRIVGFTTPEGETRVGAGIAGYVEGTDLWRGGAALLLLLKAVPLTPPSPAVQTSPKNKTASLTQALTVLHSAEFVCAKCRHTERRYRPRCSSPSCNRGTIKHRFRRSFGGSHKTGNRGSERNRRTGTAQC
jgi:hypothetical protein